MSSAPKRLTGRDYDRKMSAYFNSLHQQAISRRGLFKVGAGALAAGAVAGGAMPFLPGLSVLAQDGGTFTFALEGDVRGLEPALSYDFTANPVVCNISEGLMKGLPDGSMEPLLAESYEHPDALTYIYKIKSGIKFHNGEEMTMDDVLASLERVRDPEVASPMAWFFDPVETIEATDESTLTITLSEPSALFQFVAMTTAGHVIPKSAIEEYGIDLLRNPVGTGPFKFVKWDAGSEIELEKFEDYWQDGKPYLDRFIYKIVPEGTTRVTALKNDEVNSLTQVPPDQIETILGFENVNWNEVVGYTINYSAFRCDKPPFDDVNVRRAVAMAIPHQEIMDAIIKETGVQARQSAVPENMPGSAEGELEPMLYDVEAAKALLAESSQPDGFSFDYHVIAPNDVWIPMAVAIQDALKELNIEMNIVQYSYADMITLQQAGDYEGMMNSQWASDFPDASGNLIPLFASWNFPPQNNHSYYSNPQVDELLQQTETELDQDVRNGLLIDAQKLIAEDAPMVFHEHFKWFMPMSATFTGYEISPLWYWDSFGRDMTTVAE
ncbi:MAG: ABC transporter substrate-binding protein [Thermomicrobiales bacterium]|nr:ABC transporter substrate-binding protein [Thermomicrobiales bacterium]MCO5220813.1 ABC transporter substrate-binding protein [Thermomicrobiales bacterium]